MIRTPAVAGQFYPASPSSLRQLISTITPASTKVKRRGIAVISPHAGYIYSGGVAAETFSQVTVPDTIVILGPNHHGLGDDLALMATGEWQMPFGNVAINEVLAKMILETTDLFTADSKAHLHEHSLEVQVPFLQHHNPAITIVPICVSQLSYADCQDAGRALAQAITQYQKPVLIVASTDMSHYESRESARKKDTMALECINKLAPHNLYDTVLKNRISMCGIMPTTITLVAAKTLGATKAQQVRYTDSGETSGDINQVVGYAGYVLS